MKTMGSLFDGIGGFPLASICNDIIPVWASEIEAFPIKVTKRHFPQMIHVGDITKLDGAKLPPVDIICGGSPCQDLSVAGARAGLSGERSGLFMEQIRIVKEMRAADEKRGRTAELIRPRYMVWENVPGAFTSGRKKGEDFRIVLEEIVRIKVHSVSIPRPFPWGWQPAGRIRMGADFSLAWRCLDAQYWGVAQRRNRIFLVVDFAGDSAEKILFDQESLPGNSEKSKRTWKEIAAAIGACLKNAGWNCCMKIKECFSDSDIDGQLDNAQEQTFGIRRDEECAVGFDGYNGDMTGDVAATLGVNCGMSTGRNGILHHVAFAANQRDEIRDLNDKAGALGAQPGMKQQTFVASFSAGAGASAGGIGYSEEITPTLKGTASGNCMPTVLCLNDQGGNVMECSEDKVGTLRAQEHGHQPLVLPMEEFAPMLFENHGIDSRYTGPHDVAPTMSARYGTGGNNVPLVSQEVETYCIMGNAIDREPHNGGNGIGYQEDIAYTLTATDHHAVFSRQRVDVFCENDVVSTQSARQHKDATDLVWQESEMECDAECEDETDDNAPAVYLIRRLTPTECERLQGFPDDWTNIDGASDSVRYKALGNSVAMPCVYYIMRGIALALDDKKPSP